MLDTGVEANHRELHGVLDKRLGGNFIPCDDLKALFGLGFIDRAGLRDCRDGDFEGHGTWVASRIAGALNGFASNGVAPGVRIGSYKVLAAGLGGLSTWILSGLVAACSDSRDRRREHVDRGLHRSLDDPFDVEDYLLFTDAVDYCRARGRAGLRRGGQRSTCASTASTLTLDGQQRRRASAASRSARGHRDRLPGQRLARRLRPTAAGSPVPGGVPGVTMVSATANAIGAAPASVPLRWRSHVGARDQLAYYSNYGSRVDLAAPGGARRFQIPGYDGGDGRRPLRRLGLLRRTRRPRPDLHRPLLGLALFNSACFTARGDGFGWLQGTSMASPNAAGVAALVLSARPELRGPSGRARAPARRHGQALARELHGPERRHQPRSVARRAALRDRASAMSTRSHPIAFADAYGAGLVDAGAAVGR